MSRLGDLLRTERLRRNMTLKQVARLGGVSEGYLKDVEEGRRIIADDYFKAKALVEKLEGDIENKDKEIYDLKHDLISNQVKTENAEASMKELEAQNKELLLNKARLEATLEESLLDGKKPVKKSAHASKGANDSSDK